MLLVRVLSGGSVPHPMQDSIKLMLMGIPNVGKSSLINSLRRRYMKKGEEKIVRIEFRE